MTEVHMAEDAYPLETVLRPTLLSLKMALELCAEQGIATPLGFAVTPERLGDTNTSADEATALIHRLARDELGLSLRVSACRDLPGALIVVGHTSSDLSLVDAAPVIPDTREARVLASRLALDLPSKAAA